MSDQNSSEFKPNKPKEYRLYLIWRSLPLEFTQAGKQHLLDMGVDDEELLELVEIKTQLDFAKKYELSKDTLSLWNKAKPPVEYSDIDWRVWARHLTRRVVQFLFEGIKKDMDANRIKLWMQMVDGFVEESKITENVSKETLSNVRELVGAVNKAHNERSKKSSSEGASES